MTRLVIFLTLLFAFVPAALAQSDYRKWEFYGGYSATYFDNLAGDTAISEINSVLGEKQNLRGFEIAATGNFHKYVGVKVAYSLGLREDNFSRPAGSGTVDTSVQTFLGGLQFKDNRDDGSRFRPFGHTLFGVANQKVDIDSPNMSAVFGLNDYSVNESSFAMAFGGGVDVRLNKRISIRAVQADWLIINRGDQQVGTTTRPIGSIPAGTNFVLPGMRQDNFRLGAGIVIH